MNPSYWGPSTWDYLHALSFTYPIEPTFSEKIRFKNHYENFLLPCITCQDHFLLIIKKIKIDSYLKTKLDLAYWVFLVHNEVNKTLGKKNTPTFLDVKNKYIRHTACKVKRDGSLKC